MLGTQSFRIKEKNIIPAINFKKIGLQDTSSCNPIFRYNSKEYYHIAYSFVVHSVEQWTRTNV